MGKEALTLSKKETFVSLSKGKISFVIGILFHSLGGAKKVEKNGKVVNIFCFVSNKVSVQTLNSAFIRKKIYMQWK